MFMDFSFVFFPSYRRVCLWTRGFSGFVRFRVHDVESRVWPFRVLECLVRLCLAFS